MKKKIVSTLVVIGLLIVLGGYSYNVQYRQTTGNAERYKGNHC